MFLKRQITAYHTIIIISLLLVALSFTSCLSVKKAPAKPFVFKTNVNIETPLTGDEKQLLQSGLENQLDDSLKNRVTTSFFVRKKLVRPPVFDSNYAHRSVRFMKAYLKANGFMNGEVHWDSTYSSNKKEIRIQTDFNIKTGKQLKIDSIRFNLSDSGLQAIAVARENRSLLKKGDPYSKSIISAELDRLVELYRNQGYFRFSRENLYVQLDTIVGALFNPNLDPLEQLVLLEQVQIQREKPTIDLEIKLRPINDSIVLRKYTVGKIDIYPESQLIDDTLSVIHIDTLSDNKIKIHFTQRNYKSGFLIKHNYLIPDSLYRQRNYYRTINSFNQLGAWDQATIDVKANDSAQLLDFILKLYPGKKYNTKIDLEASRNASDVITSTSLSGIGVIFGLTNRNLNKESIQTSTNLRFGIEIGKNFIQTFQTSLGYSVFFPRFILPFKINEKSLLAQRTILSANASITDRRSFFEIQNYSTSWGYEWSKRNPNRTWFYSPLNIEYQKVKKTDSLNQLLDSIPNLQNSFKDGFIISQKFIYGIQKVRGKKSDAFRISVEESGGLIGFIKAIDRNAGLFRFVKADVDYRHYINFSKSSLVFRGYAGVGIPYGKDSKGTTEPTLPVTRAFFAGGPSSMRAWGVRQLGPGSSIYLDTLNGGGYDRLGDVQLEANVEYRFNVGTIGPIKLKSAFFADIGNIWLLNNQGREEFNDGVFKFANLYRDVAVGAGTSLRADFEYFIIRLDWAYKIKNPIYAEINSGWFQNINILKGQLQLGINYPF